MGQQVSQLGAPKDGRLSKKELKALSETTHFSIDQLKTWNEEFAHKHPTGVMTVNDIHSLFRQLFPSASPESSQVLLDYLFTIFDSDKNGTIDFKELITVLSVTRHGTMEEKLEWAFSVYDRDGNGHVDKQEMTKIVNSVLRLGAFMEKLNGVPATPEDEWPSADQIVNDMFSAMDQNNDDKLTLEEFKAGYMKDQYLVNVLLQTERFYTFLSENPSTTHSPQIRPQHK